MPPFARAAVLLPLALLSPAPGRTEAIPVPVLSWGACPPASAGAAPADAFRCATAAVPMDYSDPSGPQFTLALIQAPARDPARRIGTLFWNPGGPSDAGTAYLPAAIDGFPAEARDRFDIVSWDPRGMGGRTTPVVQCFDSAEAEAAFLEEHVSDGLPATPAEIAADAAGQAAFNAACVARNGALLAHVSTADNARDLDLLRQAVGDERLTYYGTSYGTFLGATYVNMFPERVRAAVLDGAVTPSAWAGGAGEDPGLGTFVRIGSDFGAGTAIRAFLDQCGAAEACAFSAGSPAATRAKWSALLERAAAGLTVDGRTLDDGDLLSYVGALTYTVSPVPGFDRFPGWPAVAAFLERAAGASAGAVGAAPPPAPEAAPSQGPAAPYVTSGGRQLSVVCGESPNPGTEAAFAAQVEASYARAGRSAWPFAAACQGWTARAADPYSGPWDRPTPVPVLVIGNTYDPATPLASSVRMAQELADGRLLIVQGFGHTVLLNPSKCAQDHVAAYLVEGRLPPAGASCFQDASPFPGD